MQGKLNEMQNGNMQMQKCCYANSESDSANERQDSVAKLATVTHAMWSVYRSSDGNLHGRYGHRAVRAGPAAMSAAAVGASAREDSRPAKHAAPITTQARRT